MSNQETRGQRKKKLCRLVVAYTDISMALEAADLILFLGNRRDNPVFAPLLQAMTISYARPFTRNRPLGALPRSWSRFDSSEFQEMHDGFLEMRHKFFAHSDQLEREVEVVPPGYSAPDHPASEETVLRLLRRNLTEDRVPVARSLFLHVGERLQIESHRLVSDLYEGQEMPPLPFPLTFDDGL